MQFIQKVQKLERHKSTTSVLPIHFVNLIIGASSKNKNTIPTPYLINLFTALITISPGNENRKEKVLQLQNCLQKQAALRDLKRKTNRKRSGFVNKFTAFNYRSEVEPAKSAAAFQGTWSLLGGKANPDF